MCRRNEEMVDLRSDSQRHKHFVGFLNVPVQAPTRGHGGHILDLTPGSPRGYMYMKILIQTNWTKTTPPLFCSHVLSAVSSRTPLEKCIKTCTPLWQYDSWLYILGSHHLHDAARTSSLHSFVSIHHRFILLWPVVDLQSLNWILKLHFLG